MPVHAALATQPLGFFGSLRAARSNLLEILPELAVKQPMVSGKTGVRWHMVMDPTALRRILLEKVEEYPKSVVTKNLLRPAIGESLFVAEGAHWRWQRRAAAPAFSARNIGALAPVMTAAAEASADRIATACPFCYVMIDDGVRGEGVDDDEVKVGDIALHLLEALEARDAAPIEASDRGV